MADPSLAEVLPIMVKIEELFHTPPQRFRGIGRLPVAGLGLAADSRGNQYSR
ncbi:MAG: hypothetical protein HYS05_13540 [Acidobacteria bacterium]|nr:hypothetical protein [Acidobacteriota bacterium]